MPLIPTRVTVSAAHSLEQLLRRPDPVIFKSAIRRLNSRFDIYAATSPAPLPAPGLAVTPEIRRQCELYLPLSEVARCFNRLYCSMLSYTPILSSTPFYSALSWVDVYLELPPRFQFSANPARLLEALLDDRGLMTEFLFASFLPRRFSGGFNRYPLQRKYLEEWLEGRDRKQFSCLDAACGAGEETYGLAALLLTNGFSPEALQVEGWTLDPLEVWAAAHARFPHNPHREDACRKALTAILEQGAGRCLIFRCADLLTGCPSPEAGFDLILCNGLLGGPIMNQQLELELAVRNLTAILRPGGLLLAADCFHGGWKKSIPREALGDVFKRCGLSVQEAGEGIGGLKPPY